MPPKKQPSKKKGGKKGGKRAPVSLEGFRSVPAGVTQVENDQGESLGTYLYGINRLKTTNKSRKRARKANNPHLNPGKWIKVIEWGHMNAGVVERRSVYARRVNPRADSPNSMKNSFQFLYKSKGARETAKKTKGAKGETLYSKKDPSYKPLPKYIPIFRMKLVDSIFLSAGQETSDIPRARTAEEKATVADFLTTYTNAKLDKTKNKVHLPSSGKELAITDVQLSSTGWKRFKKSVSSKYPGKKNRSRRQTLKNMALKRAVFNAIQGDSSLLEKFAWGYDKANKKQISLKNMTFADFARDVNTREGQSRITKKRPKANLRGKDGLQINVLSNRGTRLTDIPFYL